MKNSNTKTSDKKELKRPSFIESPTKKVTKVKINSGIKLNKPISSRPQQKIPDTYKQSTIPTIMSDDMYSNFQSRK